MYKQNPHHSVTTQLLRAWQRFLAEEQGQDVVEYSLLLVLLGAVAMVFITGMGINVNTIFSKLNARVDSANASLPE